MKKLFPSIIPEEKPIIPQWVNVLFIFSLGLVVIFFVSFLLFSNRIASLKEEKKSLEAEIGVLALEKGGRLTKEISTEGKKLLAFADVLKKHRLNSNFFTFLESITHPEIRFTSLGLDSKNYAVSLKCKAASFQALAEELSFLKANQDIENLRLSDINLSKEGEVNFTLQFSFSPNLLEFKGFTP